MGKLQLIKQGLRRCYACKKTFLLNKENFSKNNKKGEGGYAYICKSCQKKRAKIYWAKKQWSDSQIAKRKITNKRWYERNRNERKIRRLRLRFQIFQRDNFTCQYCGRKPPEAILEIDHRFPRSKGGKNNIKNYITSCRECNLGKGDIILKEFL